MMIESGVGFSTGEQISVRGRDLARDLMGCIDFTDMCILEITGEVPTAEIKTLTNAILVMLSDHGITPSVIAARMTLLGAPEAIQGAVAAGILGAGDHFLGTSQNVASLLQATTGGANQLDPATTGTLAARIVEEHIRRKQAIPGLGHPLHKKGDPRTPRLFEIARDCGFYRAHCELLTQVQGAVSVQRGKNIPLNAAGAVGAVISDMGWRPVMARALAMIARVPGLLAHVFEEIDKPQGAKLWDLVVKNSTAFDLSEDATDA